MPDIVLLPSESKGNSDVFKASTKTLKVYDELFDVNYEFGYRMPFFLYFATGKIVRSAILFLRITQKTRL